MPLILDVYYGEIIVPIYFLVSLIIPPPVTPQISPSKKNKLILSLITEIFRHSQHSGECPPFLLQCIMSFP